MSKKKLKTVFHHPSRICQTISKSRDSFVNSTCGKLFNVFSWCDC